MMRLPIAMALGLATLATCAEERSLLEERKNWSPGDRKVWKWSKDDAGPVLSLTGQSDVKPKVRSPFNLTWLRKPEWKSFELDLEARLTTFNDGNNDVCIAFGGKDDTHFYYLHLGETADQVHLHVHIVDGADRKPITTWRSESIPWEKDRWHKVRLKRIAESGEITVSFDGRVVLRAEDRTFPEGRIGLGSFDDTGEFRRLVIREIEG